MMDVDISFSPGQTSECINITIIDDEIVEGSQFFSLIMISQDIGVIFGNNITIVSISDNDSKTED